MKDEAEVRNEKGGGGGVCLELANPTRGTVGKLNFSKKPVN